MKKWEEIISVFSDELKDIFYKSWNKRFIICDNCKNEYPEHELFFKFDSYRKRLKTKCKKCDNSDFIINKAFNKIFQKYLSKNNKVCLQCFKILPNTKYYFIAREGSCKKCQGKEYGVSESHIKGAKNTKLFKDGLKECIYCHKIKSINEFKKINSYRLQHRYAWFCNDCEKEYKNDKREYDKKYFQRNKDNKKLYYFKWKQNGGQKLRVINEQNRRAKKLSLKCDLTNEQWIGTLDYFNNSCAYCGMIEKEHILKYNKSLSQEHIIPVVKNGEYTKNNIIPSCLSCNSSKNNMDLDNFLLHNDKFTNEMYLKILKFVDIYSN